MPDEDLAGKLHRTPQEVRKRRVSLGVCFREYAPAGRRWTIAEELLIGTDTDRAIARKLNRTSHSVLKKRWALGIPGFNRRKPWTEAEERLVRTPAGPRGGAAAASHPQGRNAQAARTRTAPGWVSRQS